MRPAVGVDPRPRTMLHLNAPEPTTPEGLGAVTQKLSSKPENVSILNPVPQQKHVGSSLN